MIIYAYFFSHCTVYLVAGVGGGSKLSRPVNLAPHLPGYQSKNYFAKSTYFKLSDVKMYQI